MAPSAVEQEKNTPVMSAEELERAKAEKQERTDNAMMRELVMELERYLDNNQSDPKKVETFMKEAMGEENFAEMSREWNREKMRLIYPEKFEALKEKESAEKESTEKEKAQNQLSLVTDVATVYGTSLEDLKSRVHGNIFRWDLMKSYDDRIQTIADLITSTSAKNTDSMDSKAISKLSDEFIAKVFGSEQSIPHTPSIWAGMGGVGKDLGVDKSSVSQDPKIAFNLEKRSEANLAKIREILASSATTDRNKLTAKKVQAFSLLRIEDMHDTDPRVLNSSEAMRSELEGDFLAMKDTDLSKYPKSAEAIESIDRLKNDPTAKKEFFSLVFPEWTVPKLDTAIFTDFFQKHGIHLDPKHTEQIASDFSDIRKAELRKYQESLESRNTDATQEGNMTQEKDAGNDNQNSEIDIIQFSDFIKSHPESIAGGDAGCMEKLSRLLIQKTVFENFSDFDALSKTSPLAKLYTNIEGLQAPETDPRHEKGLMSSLRSMDSGYLSDERVNSDAKLQQDLAEQVLTMVGVGKVVGAGAKLAGKQLVEKFGSGIVGQEIKSIGDFVGSKLVSPGTVPALATGARFVTETITEWGPFAIGYTQIDNIIGNKGWEHGMNSNDLGRITSFLGMVKLLHIWTSVVKSALAWLAEKYGPEMRNLIETKGIMDPKVLDALMKELTDTAKSIAKGIPNPQALREWAGIVTDTVALTVADTLVRISWPGQEVPDMSNKENTMEYLQSELEAIIPLVLWIRTMEYAKWPVDVAYDKDGGMDITIEWQIMKITKEQRRLLQARNIARRDGDKQTVSQINTKRQENEHILAGLQTQKQIYATTPKTIAANEPFAQGNTNHSTPNLRELRDSMRNPNIEKAAKGFGIEGQLKDGVTQRFGELLTKFPSISDSSDQHSAIYEAMANEVDTLIIRLEADKDFNYGQDKAELEKFRQDRERIISDLTKQFEEALEAVEQWKEMKVEWGDKEYVKKTMRMFNEKLNPALKKDKEHINKWDKDKNISF